MDYLNRASILATAFVLVGYASIPISVIFSIIDTGAKGIEFLTVVQLIIGGIALVFMGYVAQAIIDIARLAEKQHKELQVIRFVTEKNQNT